MRTNLSTLPKSRSRLTEVLFWFTSLLLLIGSVLTSEKTDPVPTFLLTSCLIILILILEECLFRLFNVFEEAQHLMTRYENNFVILLKDVFHFKPPVLTIVALVFGILTLISQRYETNPFEIWYQNGISSILCSLCSLLLLGRGLNLRSGPLYDSLWIENSNGLNYGSGMAQSYFYGFFKLVIPKTGTSGKHLKELMQEYEDKHQVKIEYHKLFILIPKSLHCPTSLKDEHVSPSIEESSSLGEKIITVAGVRNRVYKNSVYKIKSGGNFVYVCAEYATPLKTFKDGTDAAGDYSRNYRKHKNDILLQFYKSLKKVLCEDESCKNYCELVFYDDKDENGRFKDVGRILLQRIRKLQNLRHRSTHL